MTRGRCKAGSISCRKLAVALAVFHQHAVAQQVCHRIRRGARAVVLPSGDEDGAVGFRPNGDHRLEAGQLNLEDVAEVRVHRPHRRQQGAFAQQVT
jgi:hypothetical protein